MLVKVFVCVKVLQHQALSHGQEPQQIELVVQEVKVEDDKGKVDTVILNRYCNMFTGCRVGLQNSNLLSG